jgi:ATP-dependent DNA helicase RecG
MNVYELIQSPIDALPRTQSRTKDRLRHLGVETLYDLLHHIPHRYEDARKQFNPQAIGVDDFVSAQGMVRDMSQTFTRSRKTIQKAVLETDQGELDIIWFNQPYIIRTVRPGSKLSISGKVSKQRGRYVLQSQSFEALEDGKQPLHTSRLVPVYPETQGITSKTIREKVAALLADFDDPHIDILPEDIRAYHGLLSLRDALQQIHFPMSFEDITTAKNRLAFDEIFLTQLRSLHIRRQWESSDPIIQTYVREKTETRVIADDLIRRLPFELTSAQRESLDDILTDIGSEKPMNRFVQGDVGSGKTIIAIVAAYVIHALGYKTIVMAPTEVLAEQHARSFRSVLEPYGVAVRLHTSSRKIKKGETYDVLIGTHALLSKSQEYDRTGLVVIDEQHRFGVKQRALLRNKGGKPHVLTMTATPIPRTISLTYYGDLDISEINEKPAGRTPIKTFLVPERKRADAYTWVKKEIEENKSQVFIICPLIEESDKDTMKTVRAATKEYEYLSNQIFPEYSLALLHGRQKSSEKELLMNQFKEKAYDILVSTSVVEVGIDIPNATIMIIEGAERYGLAQLHQLRGRVGRGQKQSYCLLFPSLDHADTDERLQFFAQTENGIDLASYDLKRRGPGSMYGVEQHGHTLFKHSDVHTVSFIKTVRKSVLYFDATYQIADYPYYHEKLSDTLHDLIARD